MQSQEAEAKCESGLVEEAEFSIRGDDSTESINPMTKIQFLGLKDHYQTVLAEMESQENLRTLHAEFSVLLRKFCSSYSFQKKLLKKVKEFDSNLSVAKEESISLSRKLEEKDSLNKALEEKIEELRLIADDAAAERQKMIMQMGSRKDASQPTDTSDEYKEILRLKLLLHMERSKLNKVIDDLNNQLFEEKVEVENLSQKFEAELKLAKELEEKLKLVKVKHENEVKKLSKAYKEVLALRCEVQEKEGKLKEVSRELTKVKERVKSLENTSTLQEDNCRKYLAEIRHLSSSLESARHQFNEQAQKLSDALTQKEEMTTEIKTLTEKSRSLMEEVGTLSKEYHASLKRISMLENCLTQANEEVKLKAIGVVHLTKTAEVKQKHLDRMTQEAKGLRAQLDLEYSKVVKCDNQISHLQMTIRVKDEARLVLHEELLGTRSRLEKEEKRVKDLDFERNLLLKKIQSFCDQITAEKEQTRLLQEKTANLDKEVSELKCLLKKERERAKEMTEMKMKYNALYMDSQKQCEKVSKSNADLSTYINRMKELNREKEMAIASLKASKKKVDSINSSLEETTKKQNVQINNFKSEIHRKEQTTSTLRNEIRSMNRTLDRTKAELEITERAKTALITKIDLRGQEITLLNEKLNLVQQAMNRGKQDYGARIEDIKLLKTQLSQKHSQITCLQRKVKFSEELKRELIGIQKALMAAKLRIKALERQMQQHVNTHGWRIIKTTDPEKFQLITKNRVMQKTLTRKTELLQLKETQLQEVLDRNQDDRRKLSIAKTERLLLFYRSKCNKQKDKIDSLSGQLNMYDDSFLSYKGEIACLREELAKCKQKEYFRKLKERPQ